jgi:hypothetical protein
MVNLPGKEFKLVYEDAGVSTPTKVTVANAPSGSARSGTALQLKISFHTVLSPVTHNIIDYVETRVFSFVPDVSGIYQLELEFNAPTANVLETIEVATKLTRRIGAIESATLHVWVQDSAIVPVLADGKAYPYLATTSQRGAFAAQTASVKSALLFLVGGTNEPRLTSALTALESAWIAALVSPTTVEGQSLAVVNLVASGWALPG